MTHSKKITRRNFMRNVGIASSIAVIPGSSLAKDAPLSGYSEKRTHRVLSCNIRVALESDEERGIGWSVRRDACIRIIRAQAPDIICMQEVLKVQNEDMKKAFPGFQSFGFEGPEMDAHEEGYHGIAKNVIMFSRQRYELTSAGCYWLSETPHLGGTMSWGTARARQVNWVRLKEHKTGREIRVLNTHLDHRSQQARERQMAMILEEAAQYPEAFAQLFAGDMNADAENPIIQKVLSANWQDSYAQKHGDADPGHTYHAFLGHRYLDETPPERVKGKIDFIFSRGKIATVDAGIIRDHENGRYPSDHFFIFAELK